MTFNLAVYHQSSVKQHTCRIRPYPQGQLFRHNDIIYRINHQLTIKTIRKYIMIGNKERYDFVHIIIYWLTAVIIMAMFANGLYMEGLTFYDSGYRFILLKHKSFGVVLTALFNVTFNLVKHTI